MAFTFAAFSYIAALIIDAFLLFFSIFHVSRETCSKTPRREKPDLNVLDHSFWRAENWLQESHRPVQQPEPAGVTGIPAPHPHQHPLPGSRGVVHHPPQPPAHCLPHPQVGVQWRGQLSKLQCSGTFTAQWCPLRGYTTPLPSWTPRPWTSARGRAGPSWPSTSSPSSTTSMGKITRWRSFASNH